MAGSPNPRTPPRAAASQIVRALSAEDLAILALEDDTVAGHTCKVIVLDQPTDPDRLRAAVASRLAGAPDLSLSLRDSDAGLCWALVPGLVPADHIVVAGSEREPDDREVQAIVARLFEERLDRTRPLWRIDVIPRLADGGSAIVWRIHHALADGSSAMRMAAAVLWEEEPAHSTVVSRALLRSAAAGSAGRRLGGLLALTRETPRPWRGSPFDGRIGAQRAVAFAHADLPALRRAAAAVDGATVNDAVLAVVAGGLRRWLEASHGRFGAVRVKVPVSLHGAPAPQGAGEPESGNRDSFFCVDLPLGSPDPLDRLSAIRRATRVRKADHDAQHLDALMRELGHVAPGLRAFAEHALAHPRSFALNVSNVPGPHHTITVLGAPVRALYTLAEIRERHALRIAVTSLCDELSFGLCADPTLLPDVDRLAAEMQAEAQALGALATPR